MGTLKGWVARLRALLRRGVTDKELDDEIAFHIERETEKHIALGMDPAEAHQRARAIFGGVVRTREEHREVRGLQWLEDFFGDVKQALRALRRSPTLAVAAIVTLALGIGANTAIFSAVNAVILRPLPLPGADRLVMLWEENPERGWYQQDDAPANYLDWREQVPAFQDAAAYQDGTGRVTLAGDRTPQVVTTATVTGNFFSTLGVPAELGRTLRDEETWDNGTHVVVVSDRLWRDRFGADPSLVGRTVQLDGYATQVVGVMPPSLALPKSTVDAWLPMRWAAATRSQVSFRRAHFVRAIARLRPGVSIEAANAQLQGVAHRLEKQYPETNRLMGAGMTPLQEFLVGDTRTPLLVLMAAVALLLIIACANVGNLMLVRAASRQRDVALRLALGAGRARLVRQALTESLVLSVLGGAGGLALGWWGTHALVALQPAGLLRVRTVDVDWSVVGYVLAISMASGLLFGIAPAMWSVKQAPNDALKEGGRSGSDSRRMRRWGDALVIGEVALALVLTAGAGLLVRSFWELRQVNPGFDPNGVLSVSIDLPDASYDTPEKAAAFYEPMRSRLLAVPGVRDAAWVSVPPLVGGGWTSDFTVAGRVPGEYGTEISHREIGVDYFRTMHVPLLRGRAFTSDDRKGTTPVVVINDAFARSYFRGQDPVGQRIAFERRTDSTTTWRTIVGVVGTEHQVALGEAPKIEVFEPYLQQPQGLFLVVRATAGDPAALGPTVRRVVGEIDPGLAIALMRTMTAVRDDSLARQRFVMTLLLVFAVVGLALAVVGVYGVLAHLARRRTREMGIRLALGAQSSQVRWLVVRHGLQLVAVGLVAGTLVGLFATRALRGLLFMVPPTDALTFLTVGLTLALTGVLASWIPATQAARADPASVLREE